MAGLCPQKPPRTYKHEISLGNSGQVFQPEVGAPVRAQLVTCRPKAAIRTSKSKKGMVTDMIKQFERIYDQPPALQEERLLMQSNALLRSSSNIVSSGHCHEYESLVPCFSVADFSPGAYPPVLSSPEFPHMHSPTLSPSPSPLKRWNSESQVYASPIITTMTTLATHSNKPLYYSYACIDDLPKTVSTNHIALSRHVTKTDQSEQSSNSFAARCKDLTQQLKARTKNNTTRKTSADSALKHEKNESHVIISDWLTTKQQKLAALVSNVQPSAVIGRIRGTRLSSANGDEASVPISSSRSGSDKGSPVSLRLSPADNDDFDSGDVSDDTMSLSCAERLVARARLVRRETMHYQQTETLLRMNNKNEKPRLFELCAVISLQKRSEVRPEVVENPVFDGVKYVPTIQYRFPIAQADRGSMRSSGKARVNIQALLENLPCLCYPDYAKMEPQSAASFPDQQFVVAITNENGIRKFAYCIRFCRQQTITNFPMNKTSFAGFSLPEVIAVVAPVQATAFYFALLNNAVSRYRACCNGSAENNNSSNNLVLFREFLNVVYHRPLPKLHDERAFFRNLLIDSGGNESQLSSGRNNSNFVQSEMSNGENGRSNRGGFQSYISSGWSNVGSNNHSELSSGRSKQSVVQSELTSGRNNCGAVVQSEFSNGPPALCSLPPSFAAGLLSFAVGDLLTVFGALLCEKRVLIVADNVPLLCRTVQSLIALLYPFEWPHTLIPCIPDCFLDVCSSPTPYIIGILRSNLARVKHLLLDDSEEWLMVFDVDRGVVRNVFYADMPTLAASRCIPVHLQRNVKLMLEKATMSTTTDSARLMHDVFLTLFSHLIGHFRDHVSAQQDGSLTLQTSAFVGAPRRASVRIFLRWFVETGLFHVWKTRRLGDIDARDLLDNKIEQLKSTQLKSKPALALAELGKLFRIHS